MQTNDPQGQAPGLKLADIYYTLFRHKWKILGLSAAGFLAAGIMYLVEPAMYSSEAKLFIRYVVESRLPSGVAGDSQIKTPDPGGANIINSEIEIIKSLDLASQVVDAIGPEKIIGQGPTQTNKYMAAVILRKGLTVEVPPQSDILRISFQHPNRGIVQPVLDQLITAYLLKHVEIHSSVGGFDDVLQRQTDDLQAQLNQTEAQLRQAQTNAGVLPIEDAQKAYAEELSKIQEELFGTQAELAERQAAFQERQKLMPAPAQGSTNHAEIAVPAEKIDAYRSLNDDLALLRRSERDLLAQFTGENARVRGVRQQIASAERARRSMEAQFPQLVQIQPASTASGAPGHDPADDLAQITALKAKLKVLNDQWDKLSAQAKAVSELEPAITELKRKKQLQEDKYRRFSTDLDQARFDEALSAGKMSNISVAQKPTPPLRESRQLLKALALVVAGGVGAGFGLAFVLELFVDSTVRRPGEVETRLHLPLFLTIPNTRRNGHATLPQPGLVETRPSTPTVAKGGANGQLPALNAPVGEVVAWPPNDGLWCYHEALRDRLVTYFEVNNLTRKPKLVAVTGCATEAGVTTVATGLAASLSETGDGNVLLVDMTCGQGAAHEFFRGKPACGLAEALEGEKRDGALVQDNLYVVAEGGNGDKLPRMLPRRFHNLLPKLKASDYDYIIFDMPPVNQISITPRLAGFMDMVLMVIESEKTDREAAKRAAAMLAESKANVSAVLNKARRYVPKALQQEL